MPPSASLLASLRKRIGAIEGTKPPVEALFGLGHDVMDRRLGGGLARGRLHELFATDPHDHAAAIGFALMLTIRAGSGPVVWVRQDGAVRAGGPIHAPGMLELGFDPTRLIEVLVPDEKALLRAAGDAVRCPDVAVLLVEPWKAARAIDLTASRRLATAAEHSGVTVLMIRAEPDPGPSAAHSRWRIAAAPATPLMAEAPGHATIEASLLRHRGGVAEFSLSLEWNRDQLCFREPALSGAVVSLPADRPAAPRDAVLSG